ncbi:MAG: hypothetical protein FWC39_10705 [Bacteroidetes bacterium]|nr:hypothetical protein [Bacteroidota bacterium]
MKNLYRVEFQNIDVNKIYNSDDLNYGSNFDFKHYQHFINTYLQVMYKNNRMYNNISVDFLVEVNNQIFMLGNDYLQILSNAIVNEEYIDIHKITENPKHKNQLISIALINEFIQNFDEVNNFIFFDNGMYLWETFLEIVRSNFFNNCPKRLSSVFFFDSLESCNHYITNHLNGIGKIYQIELLETKSFFEADMKIIDNIENQILFEDLLNECADYWSGKMTKKPIKEIIFQGKYKYKNII